MENILDILRSDSVQVKLNISFCFFKLTQIRFLLGFFLGKVLISFTRELLFLNCGIQIFVLSDLN